MILFNAITATHLSHTTDPRRKAQELLGAIHDTEQVVVAKRHVESLFEHELIGGDGLNPQRPLLLGQQRFVVKGQRQFFAAIDKLMSKFIKLFVGEFVDFGASLQPVDVHADYEHY